MKARHVVSAGLLAVVLLGACKRKDKGKPEPTGIAPLAESTGTVPAPKPPLPGKPAGQILDAHPELLVSVSDHTFFRLLDSRGSTPDNFNCPELDKITETEPFAKREAEEKAREACKPRIEHELAKAKQLLEGLKKCPLIERLQVGIHEFDFARGVFPIWAVDQSEWSVRRAGRKGQAVVDRWLLDWPSATPNSDSAYFKTPPPGSRLMGMDHLPAEVKTGQVAPCNGPLVNVVPALAMLTLELSLPSDDAKVLSKAKHDLGRAPEFVEAALLVPGERERPASMPCGQQLDDRIPASVLAWRVALTTDDDKEVLKPKYLSRWISERTWDPPETCDDVKKLGKRAKEGVLGLNNGVHLKAPSKPPKPKPTQTTPETIPDNPF